MNLAEIRKKARQHKDGEQNQPQEARVSGSVDAAEKVDELLEERVLPATDRVAVQPPPGAEQVMDSDEKQEVHAAGLDPLQVLLAGRRNAGQASDTVTDPHAMPSDDEEDVVKYLRFRVAAEEYGVNLLEIREIIKSRAITEVPRMPEFVPGVLSLRGTIIPVLDLRLRLGLPVAMSSGSERVIIAKHGEGSCGLLVDEVYQVLGLPGNAIDKTPPVLEGINRDFVKGIGRLEGMMLILLDLEKVMDVSLV